MSRTYTNYRWEPVNVRKGDRFHYKRDVVYADMPWRPRAQVIAMVTYNDNYTSPYWGKWHVSFGAQTPELYALRQEAQDRPKFSSKDDAIAWTTAMVRLSL